MFFAITLGLAAAMHVLAMVEFFRMPQGALGGADGQVLLALGQLALAVMAGIAAYEIAFDLQRSTRGFAIAYLWAAFLVSVLLAIVADGYGAAVAGSATYATVWTVYLRTSRRVKATFPR